MKKSEIKNGMHVITRSGDEYVIVSDIYAQGQIDDHNTSDVLMLLIGDYGWMKFDEYNEDLTFHDEDGDGYEWDDTDREYDIVEVYTPKYYIYTLASITTDGDKFTRLWKRDVKKMTKREIEKELGYEIEIVD